MCCEISTAVRILVFVWNRLRLGCCIPDAVLNRLLSPKVARDRKGMAPNKPLLVLAILDLVEAGLVGMDGLVHKDAQLNLRFRS